MRISHDMATVLTSVSDSCWTTLIQPTVRLRARAGTREVDSSATSVRSQQDREAERLRGESMKFWKKPVIRQYFHKGLIWRASETTEVASFELFVDLLYVGIIAINGDRAAEDPTGTALLQFCVTFILSWKLWSELTLIVSWFETGMATIERSLPNSRCLIGLR